MPRPSLSATQRSTTNATTNANRSRTRELLIWACFGLLTGLAVATVLLPETQSQKDPGDGNGPAGAAATPAHR